jgi:Domain of unknown function (DUF4388)
MQGNLSQINLNDLLLLATSGKKSGVLKLIRGKETVEVYLSEGNIVHAKCPIGEGEKALLYPVTWGDGTFNLLPNGTAPEATITKASSQILADIKAMTHEWETILDVVPSGKTLFRIADLAEDNTGPITIPNVGWRVLSRLDGVRTVQEIAEVLRIPFAYIAKVLFNLHQAGLIETVTAPVKPVGEMVPTALLDRLSAVLTEVIGPMAPLVIRDQVEALGASTDSLPESKLDDLIGLIGQEISDAKQRHKFEESIYHEISNFKRF